MMVSFNNKKINAIKTLGEKLQEHRLSYGLSLEDIARDTQININYLIALENDNFSKLPADVYTRNFLRKYAEFLDLNAETVIETFEQEKNIYFKTQKHIKTNKMKQQSGTRKVFAFFLNPQFIKYAGSGIVIILLLVYIGWGVNRIFTPPELLISEPINSLITDDRQVWVKGETEKEVLLTINGQEVISDRQGYFENQIDLQKGLNVIKITAQKKHSKENVQYLQIIVEESSDMTKK